MAIKTLQDLLSLIGGICLALITVFLCWALFQIGKLVRQANQMIKATREKAERFEQGVLKIGEKLGSMTQYLGFITEGGKQVLAYLQRHEKRATAKKSTKKEGEAKLSDMPEEEHDA